MLADFLSIALKQTKAGPRSSGTPVLVYVYNDLHEPIIIMRVVGGRLSSLITARVLLVLTTTCRRLFEWWDTIHLLGEIFTRDFRRIRTKRGI